MAGTGVCADPAGSRPVQVDRSVRRDSSTGPRHLHRRIVRSGTVFAADHSGDATKPSNSGGRRPRAGARQRAPHDRGGAVGRARRTVHRRRRGDQSARHRRAGPRITRSPHPDRRGLTMLAGLAFGSEIKRFGRSRMTRVAIVVLMLLPLVYGALYLWAFWDPFGHVNKMPVALVNSDRGAVVSGQQFNAGTEIAKSLTTDGSLDWHVDRPEEARSGVEHGKYYFMLELPPDFSAAIASPVTGQPKKAK